MSHKKTLKFKTLELIVEDEPITRFAVVAGSLCGIPDPAKWRHVLGLKESGGDPNPMIVHIDGVAATLAVRHCTLQHILETQRMALDEPVEFRLQAYARSDKQGRAQRKAQIRMAHDVVLRLSP
ncbi:MAG: hypothetical protein WBK91_09965 [Alphaproteobacteria bacterium]